METIKSEIVVVGGGGAGMSAAAAASEGGANVLIIDDNQEYGGQIWRAGIDKKAPREARDLIRRLEKKNVQFIPGATVFDGSADGNLFVSAPTGTIKCIFEKLIIAAGARERFLPFPGWTLPNVYGAGGLQALVKGGLNVKGKRIIVAGTGPLLFAVADYLQQKGAEVLFVAEQAGYLALAKFTFGLVRFPSKLRQAVSLRLKTGAPKILAGAYVVEAFGDGIVESVRIKKGGKTKKFKCDMLAVGFHMVPNLELPLLLGCKKSKLGIEVDDFQETSLKNIYAAGETTGIGGIELSCIEGEIAGYAATGKLDLARSLFDNRKKYARFASHLNRAFKLRDKLDKVVLEETIVCRCEDVTYGVMRKHKSWREAKLQDRCGMGPCQGRICGPAAEYLFGWDTGGVRPPIFPVKLGDLGNYEL